MMLLLRLLFAADHYLEEALARKYMVTSNSILLDTLLDHHCDYSSNRGSAGLNIPVNFQRAVNDPCLCCSICFHDVVILPALRCYISTYSFPQHPSRRNSCIAGISGILLL
uniref:RxLR effector candidate protein n=1 Tax=Hyaloperonospora arabidopsidis (strain Emoy2) TaxID=559515 RepID=M4BJI5_HYAAE